MHEWRRRWESLAAGRGGSLGLRLRSDLRILKENISAGGRVNVRIVDPVNGKHYSFNEQEFFLCELADGARSLPAICALYERRFGQAISHRELRTFYRRLKIFGLLEPVGDGGEDADGEGRVLGEEDDGREDGQPFWLKGGRTRGAFGDGGAGSGCSGEPEMGALWRALLQARAGDGAWRGPRAAGDGGSGTVWLFTPNALFTLLVVLFYPLKFLSWLIWPAALLAGMTVFHRWDEFAVSAVRVSSSLSTVTMLVVSLLSVNLISRLAQGTVLKRVSGVSPRLGLRLALGVVPRFVVDTAPARALEARAQAAVFAAPLLARLACFVAGILCWAFYRHTGTALAEGALVFAHIGFAAFVLTALPLLPSDGMQWLAARLGDPQLKVKALAALRAKLTGAPPPPTASGVDAGTLALFGGAIVLTMALLVLAAAAFVAIGLKAEFQGAGVGLFLAIFACFAVWAVGLRWKLRRRPAPGGGRAIVAAANTDFAPAGGGRLRARLTDPALAPALPGGEVLAEPPPSVTQVGRVFWGVLLMAALAVAFLPYDYETGGEFRVLPTERQSVAVRTSGEVTAIHSREGDWVEAGQVLASLSSWNEERDLAVAQAELEKARATLADLEARPKPEQVVLAQRQVDSARATVAFSKAEWDRAEYLYKSGSGSLQAVEKTRTTYDQNIANLNIALANLDLVKSGATAAELEAARAEVRRLEHEVAFRRDQLERTQVRAPAAGRIITPNIHLLSGKYLTNGQPFAELEDTRVVQVEIAVPETDVGVVAIGDEVRIKAWAYSDKVIPGTVTAVAPAVEDREFGRVVRITANIANDGGELKSGMTGFAKIAGAEMPVWEAYLRLIVRFFRVEAWSWIP